MSRGFGKLQLLVINLLRRHGKPATFNEIFKKPPGAVGNPSAIRAARRAIHKLVQDQVLVTIGGGSRADPFRYFFHPIAIAMMIKDNSEADALLTALLANADPTPADHRL